jgi:hypothetical protein
MEILSSLRTVVVKTVEFVLYYLLDESSFFVPLIEVVTHVIYYVCRFLVLLPVITLFLAYFGFAFYSPLLGLCYLVVGLAQDTTRVSKTLLMLWIIVPICFEIYKSIARNRAIRNKDERFNMLSETQGGAQEMNACLVLKEKLKKESFDWKLLVLLFSTLTPYWLCLVIHMIYAATYRRVVTYVLEAKQVFVRGGVIPGTQVSTPTPNAGIGYEYSATAPSVGVSPTDSIPCSSVDLEAKHKNKHRKRNYLDSEQIHDVNNLNVYDQDYKADYSKFKAQEEDENLDWFDQTVAEEEFYRNLESKYRLKFESKVTAVVDKIIAEIDLDKVVLEKVTSEVKKLKLESLGGENICVTPPEHPLKQQRTTFQKWTKDVFESMHVVAPKIPVTNTQSQIELYADKEYVGLCFCTGAGLCVPKHVFDTALELSPDQIILKQGKSPPLVMPKGEFKCTIVETPLDDTLVFTGIVWPFKQLTPKQISKNSISDVCINTRTGVSQSKAVLEDGILAYSASTMGGDSGALVLDQQGKVAGVHNIGGRKNAAWHFTEALCEKFFRPRESSPTQRHQGANQKGKRKRATVVKVAPVT